MSRLDRRITLTRLSATTGGLGTAGAWVPVGTIWAGRRDEGDAETAAAGTVQGVVSSRFIVSSSAITRSIVPSDRLTEGDLVFDVIGIRQIGRAFLEVSAKARLDP